MTVLEAIKKYAKEGDKFYTTVFGSLEFVEVLPKGEFPIVMKDEDGKLYSFSEYGRYSSRNDASQVLFPDAIKYCKSWVAYITAKKAEEKEKSELSVHDHIESSGHQYIITRIITTTDGDRIIHAVPVCCKSDMAVLIDTKNEAIKKVDKFNIKSLKPFDQVLVRDHGCIWGPNLFGQVYNGRYACIDDTYDQCIPYNNETCGLVGTRDDEPKFYKQ